MTQFSEIFYQQTKLLLSMLQHVRNETCFSLKGGTAINFFIQNMPRLSVDIDLAYQPMHTREIAIFEINAAVERIAQAIKRSDIAIQIRRDKSPHTVIPKLVIYQDGVLVKLEVNGIIRGSVFAPEMLNLCQAAQDLFELSIRVQTASLADLYAGKFCAALNRQHPRDLFDIKVFFEQHTMTDAIRQAFLIYLASDKRPFHELLSPRLKPFAEQERIFRTEFEGMVAVAGHIDYSQLSEVIPKLLEVIKKQMTANEKQFLLSCAEGDPEWGKIPFSHIKDLPALHWKLLNIKKMDQQKLTQACKALENCLEYC
jgi:predicted nucleotidyltransferase component of viral defense system